jgi:hypothetical protein
MDMGFAVISPLARPCLPQIRFLYIGSYVCSTLLSDPPSPERPCASLSLRLHQAVKGTFTPELSNMLGTPKKARSAIAPRAGFRFSRKVYCGRIQMSSSTLTEVFQVLPAMVSRTM